MAKKKKLTIAEEKTLTISGPIEGTLIIGNYFISTCPRGLQIRTFNSQTVRIYPISESSVIIR